MCLTNMKHHISPTSGTPLLYTLTKSGRSCGACSTKPDLILFRIHTTIGALHLRKYRTKMYSKKKGKFTLFT